MYLIIVMIAAAAHVYPPLNDNIYFTTMWANRLINCLLYLATHGPFDFTLNLSFSHIVATLLHFIGRDCVLF